MFAGDTNLFFNHKEIKHLFTVVNNKLVNIKDWFTANKPSLTVEKTNTHSSISLFVYENLKSVTMKSKEKNLSSSLGFYYINTTWKEHIKLTENKIAKNKYII